ncbi:MAG: urea amidolyase associated protein UAAP2 [Kiritimatiellia bacterium]
MSTLTESTLDPDHAIFRQVIAPGDYWMHTLESGQTLRIVDLEGNQAADTLFYNAFDKSDRYSAVDTIREQGGLYLTTGSRLLSQNRTHLLTITADTCGHHDTIGGACACESNSVRYPLEKRYMHACRESWLLAMAEAGEDWDKRDLANNINFFMNVPVTPEGGLKFDDGISAPGRYVELLAETDVIALISNCPQLNNPCNAYNPTPVEVLIWEANYV